MKTYEHVGKFEAIVFNGLNLEEIRDFVGESATEGFAEVNKRVGLIINTLTIDFTHRRRNNTYQQFHYHPGPQRVTVHAGEVLVRDPNGNLNAWTMDKFKAEFREVPTE